jgi:hypothetical protein
MVVLLVGLSLEVEAWVVMPMVTIGTFKSVMKRPMVYIELIEITPMVWPLARLRRIVPILGVPAYLLWGDGVGFDCCSSKGLMGVDLNLCRGCVKVDAASQALVGHWQLFKFGLCW